jgi:branched-chain amino acid transport system substrate-binding protein
MDKMGDMTDWADRRRKAIGRAATLLLVSLTLAACGNRLPHGEIVTSALGVRPAVAAGASSGNQGATAVGSAAAAALGTAGSAAAGSAGVGSAAAGSDAAAGAASGGAQLGGSSSAPAELAGGSTQAAVGGSATAGSPAGGTGQATTLTGSPVVIGNIGTYSGIIGALFSSGQQMAYVWAKWVNAHGGLDGHPVEMVTADDGGDPNKYLSEVEQMVQDQHVIAFMGNLVPLSASGAVQYLQQHQIPVVGGDSTTDVWFQSPVMFPDATQFQYFSLAAARQAVAAGKPKVGVIYCLEVDACHTWNSSLQGGDAAKEGASITYTSEVSLAQPDFTAQCLQASASGAQTLLAAVDASSLERLSRDCSAQGYHPLYVAVSLAVVNQVASDPDLQGLVAPQGDFPWTADDTPATQDYQAAINLYAPGLQGSGASASVWTSGVLFQTAAAHLPANPTSHDIFEGLWSISNDTLGGLAPPITYHQGQGATGSSCYFLAEVEGGRWIAPEGSKSQCL